MPLLCTYRLNWARRTSWGWWDEWDDTALQTQDSKFKPWRSEAEHATSRSLRLSTILSFRSGWGRNIFVSFKPPRPGTETPNSSVKLAWNAAVLTTTPGPPPCPGISWMLMDCTGAVISKRHSLFWSTPNAIFLTILLLLTLSLIDHIYLEPDSFQNTGSPHVIRRRLIKKWISKHDTEWEHAS